MPSSGVQSHLNLMDVFADVIPGTMVLSGLLLLAVQSGQASPEGDLAGITLGLVFSFVIGRLLQTMAPAVTFVVEGVERVPRMPDSAR
jgi:hypothetical protein